MCDTAIISRLFVNVLHEDILKYRVSEADIRAGIQNMKEVYLPDTMNLTSSVLQLADYNDPAHRCAYMHKYAPLHTALVADMLQKAILHSPKVFRDVVFNKTGQFNICSLGGGPGNDVIGALLALSSVFGCFQASATVVDYMPNWRQTFGSLIQELRYGSYEGSLAECVSHQYFTWDYIGSDLLSKMASDVNKAIGSANLVTMIKFVSAAASKDTSDMIKKIFRSMKPGALVLYIDNAGGGYHNLVKREAQEGHLITVFGPLKHQHYVNNDFNVKRFGYTPCLETKVSVHIWRKPSSADGRSETYIEHYNPMTAINMNEPRRQNDVNSWYNHVNNYIQGIRQQPVAEQETYVNTVENHLPRRPGAVRQQPRYNNRRQRQRSRNRYRNVSEDAISEEDEEEEPVDCCCVIS